MTDDYAAGYAHGKQWSRDRANTGHGPGPEYGSVSLKPRG